MATRGRFAPGARSAAGRYAAIVPVSYALGEELSSGERVPCWHDNLSRQCRFETPPRRMGCPDRAAARHAGSGRVEQREARRARSRHPHQAGPGKPVQRIDHIADYGRDLSGGHCQIIATGRGDRPCVTPGQRPAIDPIPRGEHRTRRYRDAGIDQQHGRTGQTRHGPQRRHAMSQPHPPSRRRSPTRPATA